jgi:hypothetical protein
MVYNSCSAPGVDVGLAPSNLNGVFGIVGKSAVGMRHGFSIHKNVDFSG